MGRLQADLDRLCAAPPDPAHLDALQRILDLPAVQQVVAALGRSPAACPVIGDTFALLFILALGLFPTSNYRNVARRLLPADQAHRLPSRATLAAARQRLGPEPLRLVAQAGPRPLAGASVPGPPTPGAGSVRGSSPSCYPACPTALPGRGALQPPQPLRHARPAAPAGAAVPADRPGPGGAVPGAPAVHHPFGREGTPGG